MRGGGEKRGEEVAPGDQLMPLIKLRGGGEQGKQLNMSCSNCIHDMYSFPFHLSFSYLCPAVEASLDMKKFHMERNTHNVFLQTKHLITLLVIEALNKCV